MAPNPVPFDVRLGLTKDSDVSFKLRWGIIGACDIASDWVKCLNEVPGAVVQAVAARFHDKAKEWAAKHNISTAHESYDALFADPDVDIVYIGTINSTHKDLTLRAIEAGKHVLCEKPLAETLADAEEMYRAADAKGVTLLEGMWARFFPAMDKARELLESGQIGEVTYVHSDFPDLCYAVQAAPLAFGDQAQLRCVCAAGVDTAPIPPIGASGAVAHFDKGCALFGFPKFESEFLETTEIVGSKGRISLQNYGHCPTRLVLAMTPQKWWRESGNTRLFTATAQLGVFPEETTFDFSLPEPAGHPHPDWCFANQHGFIYQAEAVHRCLAAGLREFPQWTRNESLMVMHILDEIKNAPMPALLRERTLFGAPGSNPAGA